MAQFDYYANPNPRTRKTYPYLLDIQSRLLDQLCTRIVVPLAPMSGVGQAHLKKLNPVVSINDQNFAILTQQLAAIDGQRLGKVMGNLKEFRSDILAAVDLLITGF